MPIFFYVEFSDNFEVIYFNVSWKADVFLLVQSKMVSWIKTKYVL